MRAVLVAGTERQESERVAAALRRLVRGLGIEVPAGGGPVAIIRSDTGTSGLREGGLAVQIALATALGREPPWIGIGDALTETRGLRRSNREAEEAIRFGRALWSEPRVVLYEDVLVSAAISADPTLLARLASVLDPIVAYDRRRRTCLLPTLQVFLEADMSGPAAAGSLGIHRHTLEYRVRGVERILGRSVRRGPDRLLVQTALIARRIQEGRRAEEAIR